MTPRASLTLALTFWPALALRSREAAEREPLEPANWTTWLTYETNGTDGVSDVFECWRSAFLRRPKARRRSALRVSCLTDAACEQALSWSRSQEMGNVTDVLVHEAMRLGQVVTSTPDVSYMRFYFEQIRFMIKTLQKGVLHTGLDALWVGSVEKRLMQVEKAYPNADMIYSMSNVAPQKLAEEWGFTLCNDFALYRRTSRMLAFLDELIPTSWNDEVSTSDEQEFINYLVWMKGCEWHMEIKSDISDEPFNVGRCGQLQIVVLPEAIVGPSTPNNENNEAVVWHDPLSLPRELKVETFRNLSLCK